MKNILISISLRNLIRQKRRNILLGIAMAFGTMILILASSFSHGITDTLFNRIIKYVAGHVSISYIRNGNIMNPLFPDKDRIWAAVHAEVPNPELAQEAIGIFSRGIGNGKADNVILVGIDLSAEMNAKDLAEYQANFQFIEGAGFDALNDSTVKLPVAIAVQKAKYLNLKMGDALRVRFSDAHNQSQSAQLTVVAIFKPSNDFMSSPVFLNTVDLRKIAGYGPRDIATIQVNVHNPKKEAKIIADKIHDRLKPGLGVIEGTLNSKNGSNGVTALGFLNDTTSHRLLASQIPLTLGDSASAFGSDGVIVSSSLAATLNVSIGDTVRLHWKSKFDSSEASLKVTVSAIADSSTPLPQNSLLLNEKKFYTAYYEPWPIAPTAEQWKVLPDSTHPLFAALAPEFRLMKRCQNTAEVTKIMRETSRARYKGIMVQVQSMYETASAVLQLESVLNLITLIAVMVLFFIILIGVINTLRMTIRERTREIGTVRAIGMQQADVRNSFLLETVFLALFASIVGTILAFVAMAGLSALKINAQDNPLSMLLVEGHLHFVPSITAVIGYNILIVGIAAATAWFPARRAAKLSAATALRHYE